MPAIGSRAIVISSRAASPSIFSPSTMIGRRRACDVAHYGGMAATHLRFDGHHRAVHDEHGADVALQCHASGSALSYPCQVISLSEQSVQYPTGTMREVFSRRASFQAGRRFKIIRHSIRLAIRDSSALLHYPC